MNQIRNYIDAMFSSLPKTREIVEMKLNMLENMEEKFNELLKEGKSENEAVGIIITDFGSMEELKEELGLSDTTSDHNQSENQSESEAENNNSNITDSAEDFGFDSKEFNSLKEEYMKFKKNFAIGMSIACFMFLLSPAMIFLPDSIFGSTLIFFMFFSLIACGSGIFIYFGIQDDKYKELLNLQKRKESRDNYKLLQLVNSIIFPITTVIYLCLGFFGGLWHPGWIIFIIAAIITSGIKSFISYKKDTN